MKWKLCLPALICGLGFFSPKAQASAHPQGPFGLGIVLAGPTGLSASYSYEKHKSFTSALAWGSGYLHLNIDHLWTQKNLATVDGIGIDVYFGVGLRLENRDRDDDKDESMTGVRFPVGLGYHFQKVPLQVFGELAPALVLIDSSALLVDIALGGRYFF
jgi:hypothetical protein